MYAKKGKTFVGIEEGDYTEIRDKLAVDSELILDRSINEPPDPGENLKGKPKRKGQQSLNSN